MADGSIGSLKQALNDRINDVCQRLYPQGRFEGNEFVYDPGTGKIKVAIRGNKIGVWSWFGSDEIGGDVIDLWCFARGQKLPEALDDIRSYLGRERPEPFKAPKREWKRPKQPAQKQPAELVKDYLTENRNLPWEVLERYRIGEQGRLIVFPFMRGETLVMAKLREAVDGVDPKPTEGGCEKILFGWQADNGASRRALITEGEIDAMSMAAYVSGSAAHSDILCLSVPYGGGGGNKQDWIESEYDALDRFETIFLCLDNDPVGEAGTAEIIRRLGHERCRVVKLPRKDANDCLVEGLAAADILRCIDDAKTVDPHGLRRPSDFRQEVYDIFFPPEGRRVGYSLPYVDVGDKLLFRPGELTLWSGAQGSGKSQILSNATVNWIQQDSRICIASLEMRSAQTLWRMTKQAANVGLPTRPMIDKALDWMNDGILLYDIMGKSKLPKLLEVFEYARAKYGCDQFIVDSLMRLGIANDDYRAQEETAFELVEWAASKKVHVHLVAHSRKRSEKGPRNVPEADDIKGASEIAANAFNILTVWRNHEREEILERGAPTDPVEIEEYNKILNQAGVILNCCKQRNGDWDGKARLWFNRTTYQYRGPADSKFGIEYVGAPAASSSNSAA